MSDALTALAALYQTRAQTVDTKIASINSQINAGTQTLNAKQTAEVATLSKKVSSYATPEESIKNADSVISLAQTGLDTVRGYLKQMLMMAQMASAPGISSADATLQNFRFQNIFNQIGKAATSASFNGSNLLSGTAGLNVKTGITSDAGSRMHINPVNVFGMMTAGILTNISVDTPAKASSAISQITGALAQIKNGQNTLEIQQKNLEKKIVEMTSEVKSIDSEIHELTHVDVTKLQAELKELYFQQKINYNIVSQLNASAASSL